MRISITSSTPAAVSPAALASPASPLAWLNRLNLRQRDLHRFRSEIRPRGGTLLAAHRDAGGALLGEERIWDDGGRLRYAYTPGAARGVFRIVPPGARLLLLACGPLPVIAAAALDQPEVPTAYAGGGWGDVARASVWRLVGAGIEEVVLALAATPAGARATERALEDLAGLPARVRVAPPPAPTWLDALAAARGADRAP